MQRQFVFATGLGLALLAGPVTTAPALAQEASTPASFATTQPQTYELLQAIGLYDVLEIMSVEGVANAADLENDMFAGQGGAAWAGMVANIYAQPRLVADFEAAWDVTSLDEAALAELIAYFDSETGVKLIEGELLARREFMDKEVEAAANEIYTQSLSDEDPRIAQLDTFISANGLIDLNVAGALNSNFAFYRGLTDGGAFEMELPEELMLAEVYGQEPEIRANTTLWLYSYQLTAYSGVSDEEFQTYIDLSATQAGRALNIALFQAFDRVFESVSYDLGRAASVFMTGDDI